MSESIKKDFKDQTNPECENSEVPIEDSVLIAVSKYSSIPLTDLRIELLVKNFKVTQEKLISTIKQLESKKLLKTKQLGPELNDEILILGNQSRLKNYIFQRR